MTFDIEHGDCVSIMRSMPTAIVDLTVTSPPYDGLRTYNGFSFDFENTAKELFRVTKPGGVVVWVVGDATVKGNESGTSFRQALFFKECGFNLHDTMIYEKAQACFGSLKCYLQAFEYMFVFSRGVPKTINLIRDRENVRTGEESVAARGLAKDGTKGARIRSVLAPTGKRKNIWKYGVGGGNTGHPAVFPEALASDHIQSWSNAGDLVFDPFSGSGTTALAAPRLGRKFKGCEISAEYAARSIERVRENTGMFYNQAAQ